MLGLLRRFQIVECRATYRVISRITLPGFATCEIVPRLANTEKLLFPTLAQLRSVCPYQGVFNE